MILVTVGTHPQGFDRLVKCADTLAAQLKEQVVIQYGSSAYIPGNATAFRWAASQEMERLTAEARVVIAHAAAGAVILALKHNKRLVVVPRLKQYGEHFDDHQAQLARVLQSQRRAEVIFELSADALAQAIQLSGDFAPSAPGGSELVTALQRQLSAWEAGRGR